MAEEVEDDWVAPDEIWLVRSYGWNYYVDADTAEEIRLAVQGLHPQNDQNHHLKFFEITGQECYLTVGSYVGVFKSSGIMRRRVHKLNKMFEMEEDNEDDTGFE